MSFRDAPDDVIAVTISEGISGADLDAIMDRLDALMSRHEKVHVYVETRELQKLDLSGLPSYVARAVPLFGKLDKFGRVAVVADQAWIRVGAKVEAAMLPFLSYKTFMPEQRDKAFQWVAEGNSTEE